MLTALALFMSSLALSFLLTWGVRNVANARGWVSLPEIARHVHTKPVPRLGGLAIYLAILGSILGVCTLIIATGRPFPFNAHRLLNIAIPATMIFALGLWDDIRSLSPWIKFAVQALAAVLLYAGGLRAVQIPTPFGMHHLGAVTGLIVSVIWIVWITNAFNLIDGVDGLAAGSALFSTIVVLLNALIKGDSLTLLITAALAGCILGFLRFNFNPATIFLGDSGSLFIGFCLGALALAEAQKASTLIAVTIPIVALGLPIADTSIAVARRFLSGKPLFTGDREHIHHKLLEKGLTQRQVVLILYAVSALFGLLALFLRYPGGRTIGAVLVIIGGIVVLGVQRLGYVEFFELQRVAQRTLEQREVIINNLALRRTKQELLHTDDFEQICSALVRGFQGNDFQGFTLLVMPHVPISSLETGPMMLTADGLVYHWEKIATQEQHRQWQLTLDLVSTNGSNLGTLTVFRPYCDTALTVDINLLTANFYRILADALERSIEAAALQRSSPALSMAGEPSPRHN